MCHGTVAHRPDRACAVKQLPCQAVSLCQAEAHCSENTYMLFRTVRDKPHNERSSNTHLISMEIHFFKKMFYHL